MNEFYVLISIGVVLLVIWFLGIILGSIVEYIQFRDICKGKTIKYLLEDLTPIFYIPIVGFIFVVLNLIIECIILIFKGFEYIFGKSIYYPIKLFKRVINWFGDIKINI